MHDYTIPEWKTIPRNTKFTIHCNIRAPYPHGIITTGDQTL